MKISYFLLGSSILSGCTSIEKEMAAPSNIILIITDDQCFRALSYLDEEVKTPNIDRLARNGTTFTHAYNMGAQNGAVCVGSRAMLITGSFIWDAYRYEDEYRNQDNPLSRPLWGNLMQEAGYETYFTGKWHIKRDPHDPRQSPREFVDMYLLESISVPENFQPRYPWREEMGSREGLRDERLAPFPRTEYAVKVNRQEYYAIITHMDKQIGIILDDLERSGLAENTYIFFTSDHGLAVGEHGLPEKQNMYDHRIRVPFIVAGPDIPANRKVSDDIYYQDVMASSLDIAGVEKPDYSLIF